MADTAANQATIYPYDAQQPGTPGMQGPTSLTEAHLTDKRALRIGGSFGCGAEEGGQRPVAGLVPVQRPAPHGCLCAGVHAGLQPRDVQPLGQHLRSPSSPRQQTLDAGW